MWTSNGAPEDVSDLWRGSFAAAIRHDSDVRGGKVKLQIIKAWIFIVAGSSSAGAQCHINALSSWSTIIDLRGRWISFTEASPLCPGQKDTRGKGPCHQINLQVVGKHPGYE